MYAADVGGGAGAIGTSVGKTVVGGGGCMTWNVGWSTSSVAVGIGVFVASIDSEVGAGADGGGGAIGNGVSGSGIGAGTDSTCILFK